MGSFLYKLNKSMTESNQKISALSIFLKIAFHAISQPSCSNTRILMIRTSNIHFSVKITKHTDIQAKLTNYIPITTN